VNGGGRLVGDDFSRGARVEITDVRVYPVQDEKVQAFVSIVFDRCFMINDIKIIRGKDGLFVSMPSRKRKNGDFKDVAHPLNSETRRWVEERILGSYRALVAGEAPVAAGPPSPSGPDVVGRPSPSPLVPDPGGEVAAGSDAQRGKSLEEVERHHLGDSFWGVS
jgi:stage V sporulation protein G